MKAAAVEEAKQTGSSFGFEWRHTNGARPAGLTEAGCRKMDVQGQGQCAVDGADSLALGGGALGWTS